jgi:hypothetical protein
MRRIKNFLELNWGIFWLRGLALAFIVFMNIIKFGHPFAAEQPKPTAWNTPYPPPSDSFIQKIYFIRPPAKRVQHLHQNFLVLRRFQVLFQR